MISDNYNNIHSIKFNNEYYDDIINLLQQLTNCPKLCQERFENIINNLENNHNIYIYKINNKIVGMITLLIEKKIIHNGGSVGHIEDLVVDINYRNQNIASILLNYVKNIAKQNNCYKIILDCDEKLINFYERNGYKKSAIQMRINI